MLEKIKKINFNQTLYLLERLKQYFNGWGISQQKFLEKFLSRI